MARPLIWITTGAIGAVAILAAYPSIFSRPDQVAAARAGPDPVLERRVAGLETQLAEFASEFATLADALAAIRADLASLHEESAASATSVRSAAGAVRSLTVVSGSSPRAAPDNGELVERLIAGGFSQQRAEWIRNRLDELAIEAIENRNDALRRNENASTMPLVALGPDQLLRRDIGDVEYERYLQALGREPSVNIMAIIPNSPAAAAGLEAGDRIVSYAGTRVFDMTDLPLLTAEGVEGEPVVVDILRGDLPMQIVVPRGALGIQFASNPSLVIEDGRPR